MGGVAQRYKLFALLTLLSLFTLLILLPVFTLFTLLLENSFRAKRLLCYTYNMAVWIYVLLSKIVEWSLWSGWIPHRLRLIEHL